MKKQVIEITTPFIKLDSLLKFAGISPDGVSAKQLVLNEEVSVNGEICTMRGKKIYPGDVVAVEDIELTVEEQK